MLSRSSELSDTWKEIYLAQFLCRFQNSNLGSSPSQRNGCRKATNSCPYDTNMNISVLSLLPLELVLELKCSGDLPL